MTTLTIDQRAARAAKRANKKMAQKYPLLVDQFSVTVESQVTRLTKQDEFTENWVERMRVSNIQAWERGMRYREIAIANLAPELVDEIERRYQRIYGARGMYSLPEYAGYDLADWWWCNLRDLNVTWCWENCLNSNYHNLEMHRKNGKCPTCHKPLEPVAETPKTEQIFLFTGE